jgi:hypothetical protein
MTERPERYRTAIVPHIYVDDASSAIDFYERAFGAAELFRVAHPNGRILLCWLTNTGVSASRLYWEYKGGFFNAKGVTILVAVTVFPSEQYQAPRSWTEQAYPNLIYYNRAEKGGQVAAWEQPMIFAPELRAAWSVGSRGSA